MDTLEKAKEDAGIRSCFQLHFSLEELINFLFFSLTEKFVEDLVPKVNGTESPPISDDNGEAEEPTPTAANLIEEIDQGIQNFDFNEAFNVVSSPDNRTTLMAVIMAVGFLLCFGGYRMVKLCWWLPLFFFSFFQK